MQIRNMFATVLTFRVVYLDERTEAQKKRSYTEGDTIKPLEIQKTNWKEMNKIG